MHLSPLALAMAGSESLASPSPSKKNPALVKVAPRVYRYDPYRCPATASPAVRSQQRVSPTKQMLAAYAATAAADRLAGQQPAPEVQTRSPSPCDGFVVEGCTSLSSTAAHTIEPCSSRSSATHAAGPSVPRYALVSFKNEACLFRAPFRLAPGDCVIVEADRGEHVGIVEEITTERPKRAVVCRVLRHASAAEMTTAAELLQREAALTPKVQRMSESVGLGIKVVDTEFQFDLNKLTVFYSAKNFVDFRKLQRQLFRQHRCRIWLVNWDEVRPYTSPFGRPQ